MSATQEHLICLPRVLQYYAERCEEPENRERLLPFVQELFYRAWQIDPAKGLSVFPMCFEEIFRSIVLIGDWEFFDLLASNTHGAIPITFYSWARAELVQDNHPFQDPENA